MNILSPRTLLEPRRNHRPWFRESKIGSGDLGQFSDRQSFLLRSAYVFVHATSYSLRVSHDSLGTAALSRPVFFPTLHPFLFLFCFSFSRLTRVSSPTSSLFSQALGFAISRLRQLPVSSASLIPLTSCSSRFVITSGRSSSASPITVGDELRLSRSYSVRCVAAPRVQRAIRSACLA